MTQDQILELEKDIPKKSNNDGGFVKKQDPRDDKLQKYVKATNDCRTIKLRSSNYLKAVAREKSKKDKLTSELVDLDKKLMQKEVMDLYHMPKEHSELKTRVEKKKALDLANAALASSKNDLKKAEKELEGSKKILVEFLRVPEEEHKNDVDKILTLAQQKMERIKTGEEPRSEK